MQDEEKNESAPEAVAEPKPEAPKGEPKAYRWEGDASCDLPFIMHPVKPGQEISGTPEIMAYLKTIAGFVPVD